MTVAEHVRLDLEGRRRQGQPFALAWGASTRTALAGLDQPFVYSGAAV
jgi:hypothetical protein